LGRLRKPFSHDDTEPH